MLIKPLWASSLLMSATELIHCTISSFLHVVYLSNFPWNLTSPAFWNFRNPSGWGNTTAGISSSSIEKSIGLFIGRILQQKVVPLLRVGICWRDAWESTWLVEGYPHMTTMRLSTRYFLDELEKEKLIEEEGGGLWQWRSRLSNSIRKQNTNR